MLKALGIGKKNSSANEDEVSKLQHQEESHSKWKANVKELTNIKTNLENKYASCKDEFALSRYEDLKKMIKNAITDFKKVQVDVKNIPHSSTLPRESVKMYTDPKLGTVNKLKMSAHLFASSQESRIKNDAYYGMSTKEVNFRNEELRKEVLELKQEFYSIREKFDLLSKNYEDSKKYNPAQRYNVMKDIIKDFVRS